MSKINIVTIVGARPQFIKAAAVSRAIRAHGGITEVIVHTGQHYDANMSDVFFEQMHIPCPDHHLEVGGGPHGQMTGRQLEKIESVLLEEKPDWVLVYGDTNSTLAGALAAAKLHIPVAHVEAGLRSFNRRMPEEINRVLTDHASDLLLVPTDTGLSNLAAEGITGNKVRLVGDVMYDAAMFYKGMASEPEWFGSLGIERGAYVLCTIHRAENTDDLARLRGILQGLAEAGLPVILPLHPRTWGTIDRAGIVIADSIRVVPPVGYLEMVWLETHCRVIATDSGGVQKEAYFHGKPCVTMRDETEWVELVDAGVNVLVGANAKSISQHIRASDAVDCSLQLYGAADAAGKIVNAIIDQPTPANGAHA
ncbi:UDP-2,3-diacetamido-2,3-dideoxy-D-glucuronate 2-epimerase [Luteimonas padinae]|uniref:Non-hydrolyzing UDP-N-acetylglucosamine 2-epimerase n=1 Tax=Luteimonas padinae TaxID=1714359 RepID=A0ABV6SZR3_9GAMM|nr:UDP-N-acetylglucosamine 2-epimerase (non-hydrolyzing) [Luteimonas padinae]GHD67381.1 UDP-2,3-diacetamido-2,3-dideoxy-D-glucuronate 2-epimerase [Luteimonas padinae]